MKAAFYTLGCKLNQTETESIAAAFRKAGFETVDAECAASLYIINTCTVTSKGEQKARRVIRKILTSHPDALVIVTGCYAQLDPGVLSSLGDRVVVIPLDDKGALLDLPERISRFESDDGTFPRQAAFISGLKADRKSSTQDRFRFHPVIDGFHTRPALKIQDGCDNRCSYCRVPLARGASVSLDAEEVIRRVRTLERGGKAEVVLTGVNITAWKSGGLTFPDLLSRIVTETDFIRIRLSSMEPEMIDDRFARILAEPRICPHFHLPVQSGSDMILGFMKRRYGSFRIREVVGLLRQVRQDPFFAADILAGFPGETDGDFQKTLDLVTELDFAWLHVFPFSPRPGTSAAEMDAHIPERTAGARVAKLRHISEQQHSGYISRQTGRISRIILESMAIAGGESVWQGLSENYVRIAVPSALIPEAEKGSLVECLPHTLKNGFLLAADPLLISVSPS